MTFKFSICIIFGFELCYTMFAILHIDVGDKYELRNLTGDID